MKIHEYQAKKLFRLYGIPVPEGIVARTPEAAERAAENFGLPVVLKAQVHTGGRGKAGGVKIVAETTEVGPTAEAILDLKIKDLPVKKLLVTPASEIVKEVYLSLLLDRGERNVVFIACADGGVEIEHTAKESPEKILRLECAASELMDLPKAKLHDFAANLFDDLTQVRETVDIMLCMGKMFRETDASLVEINPLIVDDAGSVIALDAKMLIDDNALFRHPELAEFRDMESEDADEIAANTEGLSFIRLSGEIGCMVNGAGLAMATMDIIKHFGGDPANFLDVGGSSDPEKVVSAFKMILKDPNVKVILINIFGGITRCDDIAKGILASLKMTAMTVPIVIRLIGTNQQEGRALLDGTNLISADTLEQGARKAVELGSVE